jgi:hypothetical protein
MKSCNNISAFFVKFVLFYPLYQASKVVWYIFRSVYLILFNFIFKRNKHSF